MQELEYFSWRISKFLSYCLSAAFYYASSRRTFIMAALRDLLVSPTLVERWPLLSIELEDFTFFGAVKFIELA